MIMVTKGFVLQTTARLRRSTMARLVGLKLYPQETVDEVVRRLVEKERRCTNHGS